MIGRRPRGARTQLEGLGLQVNEQQFPAREPQQVNRVVFQNPPPGSTKSNATIDAVTATTAATGPPISVLSTTATRSIMLRPGR